ncbi:DNA-binding transcriptional LysR family regulator [Palleronia aestuarii]|uniref:DNA-binding transcriptional LysR family regulator n=1 Tax=Palleronia aestuarii TaxID=568105 RepID=A0A2W7NJ49_9RHOB|nr:LysR family transcriptional regulator [Palleronia aestuarii]PZX11312.1 DNA-binding transcriptional LysR family regulator [Palleronia aestuarii]
MLGDPNRLRDLEIFSLVCSEGSFAAVARATGLSPSAVSKTISRLEDRIGGRLVLRTTRALTLTQEGETFLARTRDILGSIDAAEKEVRGDRVAEGEVRITTSASYATHILYPVLDRLLARHPRLRIVCSVTDQVVDLMGERADLAIRAGEMPSSSLVARSLGRSERVIVAAPGYLERRGTPISARDLEAHDLIGFAYPRRAATWSLVEGGRTVDVGVRPRLCATDGEAIRQMSLSGLGVARLTRFTIAEDLKAGRLVTLLADATVGDEEPFHVVWLGGSRAMPLRLRVILDFLGTEARID